MAIGIKGTKESCTCEKCKSACQHKPGWFLPGEAEKVAEHLGMTLQDLFDTRLAVDWWVGDEDTFLLTPALVGEQPGVEYPADPKGTCVFFTDGLCEIHPVKPFECREMIHDVGDNGNHAKVAEAWKTHQDQIKELLGREPQAADWSLFDALASF